MGEFDEGEFSTGEFSGHRDVDLFIKTHQTIYKVLMCKKHASTEVLIFSKKIIYKEKCRTLTK